MARRVRPRRRATIVQSSAAIILTPALEQRAFRFRAADTATINAAFGGITATATLEQRAFRFRQGDTATINAAFSGASPPPQVGASTLRQVHLTGSWDAKFTPTNVAAGWFTRPKIERLTNYWGSGVWDHAKNADVAQDTYLNTFGDPTFTWTKQFDAGGEELWLPWGVPNSTARPSRDMRTTSYRDSWVAWARGALADGAEGIFVDDVNPSHEVMFRRWNGSAYVAPTTNFGASSYYSSATGNGWFALLADALTDMIGRIKTGDNGAQGVTAYPNAKFMFNTQWNWQNIAQRWADPRAAVLIDACDYVLVAEGGFSEQGFGSGPGSDSGSDWNLRSLFRYVDFVHSRGKKVCHFARSDQGTNGQKYEMAAYHLLREPGDLIGMRDYWAGWPDYPAVFNIDLGDRNGARSDDGTTISATFTGGSASITPVDHASAILTGA